MSRRILVSISPAGEISVEAEGFQGKGCEAATQAIENALGKRGNRKFKPEHRRNGTSSQQQQQLGES